MVERFVRWRGVRATGLYEVGNGPKRTERALTEKPETFAMDIGDRQLF
jgi:hypothetical protein